MKIVLVRHQKVNMDFKKRYSSKDYNKAWSIYDKMHIISQDIRRDLKGFDLFVSELPRTHETARAMFGDVKFRVSDLLNEIPLVAFSDNLKKFPKGIADVVGRIQWYLNSKRQPERRRETEKRAKRTIDYIEKHTDKAYVVTHGFYMISLVRELRRRGYKIDRKKRVAFKNLETITATK